MTGQPNAADMAAFGASDYACYRWPGEEDQALRAAFCEGAAHAVSRHAPRAQHGCVFCAMGLTPDDDGNHYDRVMKKDVQCVEKRDKLRDALQQVHDFMLEDVKSGDSELWTEAYSEIFDVVVDGLSTEPTPRAPDIESLCHDYAQRWLGQDWPAMDDSEKADIRIEAHRWIKCWSAAEPAPGALNSCPCGAGEEPCPDAEGRPLCVSTERRCQKCGCATGGEEAWVDGQIWCHPCADAVPGGFALSGARSSVGSEQRTSNPQGAGSNPAERTNCPKCGREICGCTFSAEAPTKPIGWLRTWPDGAGSFVSTSEKPQEVSGTTLTPLYTSSVTSTERGTSGGDDLRNQISQYADRLRDAEVALATWDSGRNSEYWLRHPVALSQADGKSHG